MDTERDIPDAELESILKERFQQLAKPVQDAILSADVEKRLRALADTHKLHVDQWDALEMEVQLTLMGVQPAEDLSKNIKESLNLEEAAAQALTNDIYQAIFEPIRQELERNLGNPNAQEKTQTDVEAVRAQLLAVEPAQAPPVAPATPPAPAPDTTATRAPISQSYAAQQPSHERAIIEGDPYREQVQ